MHEYYKIFVSEPRKCKQDFKMYKLLKNFKMKHSSLSPSYLSRYLFQQLTATILHLVGSSSHLILPAFLCLQPRCPQFLHLVLIPLCIIIILTPLMTPSAILSCKIAPCLSACSKNYVFPQTVKPGQRVTALYMHNTFHTILKLLP